MVFPFLILISLYKVVLEHTRSKGRSWWDYGEEITEKKERKYIEINRIPRIKLNER
jgi:hypothetical protein